MSQPLDYAKKIVYGSEPYAAFAEAASGNDLRFEFVVFAEEQALSYSDLATWPNQAFPFVRNLRYLPRKQNLNLALQKIAGSRVLRAYRLRPAATSPAEQACRKDPRVIQYQEVVTT
jgi:hypothetical protein